MGDQEFIHATCDVHRCLRFALESGMQVIQDSPSDSPSPLAITQSNVGDIDRGVFYLIRPEWMFGDFVWMKISAGFSEGLYAMQPRVNVTAVTVYFSGERSLRHSRKLGSGHLSWHSNWFKPSTNEIVSTPKEVSKWCKRVASHLFSDVVIKAGVHKYHVCKGVMEDPLLDRLEPPFDFIPWDWSET